MTNNNKVKVSDKDHKWLKKDTWMENPGGYAYKKIYLGKINGKYKYKSILMHRLILGVQNPKTYTDHINGDKLDNRRSNLRPCTSSDNPKNSELAVTNKSGYKGVSWYSPGKKWRVTISQNNKSRNLGYYTSKDEAALVYNKYAKQLYGKFARLNKLDSNIDGVEPSSWPSNYVVCKICKSNQFGHVARGMCKKCYHTEYGKANRQARAEYLRKWRARQE